MRGDAVERELAWERGSGASWALRPRELGQAVFWAGSGEREREEKADRAGLGRKEVDRGLGWN